MFYALMYHFLALLEGKTLAEGTAIYREKYWVTMTACWHICPVVQLANFSLVPLHFRVLTANVVSLGWLALLCCFPKSAALTEGVYNDECRSGDATSTRHG